MSIQNIGMQAYRSQMERMQNVESRVGQSLNQEPQPQEGFADTLTDTLRGVNDMQSHKTAMIESFASGENTNVHELMITMQKASIAMQMTSAVRNKVMGAYQEIMRMSF